MKKEKLQKWKKYLKVILPVLLVLLVAGYKISTLKFQHVPDKLDVTDKNVADAFSKAEEEHNMLTLTGTGENSDYEWFYAENMISGSQDTDLTITFTDDYDDYVREALGATEVLGYYFSDDIVLNGYPQLTLKLTSWTSKDIKLYQVWNNSLQYVTDPIVNSIDGVIEATYQVTETKGIFYLAGGIHNTKLQGGQTIKNGSQTENDVPKTVQSNQNAGKTSEKTSSDKQDSGNINKSSKDITSDNSESSINQNSDDGQYINDKKPEGNGETISASAVNRKISDGTQTGKDQYETDPVPAGEPLPVEPGSVSIDYNKTYSCTLSIDCKTILDHMSVLDSEKKSYVPSDGWILKKKEVIFYEGESVFDVILRETKKAGIQMEYTMTPVYNSAYIEGINNLYEFDCEALSGWMYQVNGWYPNYGCSRYLLQDGDEIMWRYTCDLGKDVGCEWLDDTK